jgi:hypothetical protein
MSDDNTRDNLSSALLATLISPNESDQNFEAANVVDGLFAISRSLDRIAAALERLASSTSHQKGDVAEVVREIKKGFAEAQQTMTKEGTNK